MDQHDNEQQVLHKKSTLLSEMPLIAYLWLRIIHKYKLKTA